MPANNVQPALFAAAGGAAPRFLLLSYLELAQQAKVVGDEIATQHNLQHAEHWYRTAMADRRPEQDARAAFDEEILAG